MIENLRVLLEDIEYDTIKQEDQLLKLIEVNKNFMII